MTTIETEINGKPFKITLDEGASVEILDGEIRVSAKPPLTIPYPYPVYYPAQPSYPGITWYAGIGPGQNLCLSADAQGHYLMQ